MFHSSVSFILDGSPKNTFGKIKTDAYNRTTVDGLAI